MHNSHQFTSFLGLLKFLLQIPSQFSFQVSTLASLAAETSALDSTTSSISGSKISFDIICTFGPVSSLEGANSGSWHFTLWSWTCFISPRTSWHEKPNVYAFRTLALAEKRYRQLDKEALANAVMLASFTSMSMGVTSQLYYRIYSRNIMRFLPRIISAS